MNQEQQNSADARREAKVGTDKLTIPTLPRRRLTILNSMMISVFGSILILILYIFYLLFWPFNPLTLKSVTVVTPVVNQGNALIYKINACKTTYDTPMVYRKIVSSALSEAIAETPGVIAKGCSDTKVVIVLPIGTPKGKYVLYTEVIYHVNPFRNIYYYWHTTPFEVSS